MKRLLFFPSLLILSFTILNAQVPWRAKLFLLYKDSNNKFITDTVWFGCDSLGDYGYQEGLDIIDTTISKNKVLCSDDFIRDEFNTDCANLKVNIRNFQLKSSYFNFYAFGIPYAITWDSSDFKYFDTTFRLGAITINALNGGLNGLDVKKYLIGGDVYQLVNDSLVYVRSKYKQDTVVIFREGNHVSECSDTLPVFKFQIEIFMGAFTLGIQDIYACNTDQWTLYPIPFQDYLTVKPNSGAKSVDIKVGIYDMSGNLLKEEYLDQSDLPRIDTKEIISGIYLVRIYDKYNNSVIVSSKVIKL